MRVGIVGVGNIGGTLARLLVERGHEVVLANSRGPSSLSSVVASLGPLATAGTVAEAAEPSLVVTSVPLAAWETFSPAAFAGKVVADTGNYYPARDGVIDELSSGAVCDTSLLARRLPDARVVKAFNTIWSVHLGSQGLPAGDPNRRALPIAGDDAAAKAVVADLHDELGFDAFDAGPLAAGRLFMPDTPAYNVRLTLPELRAALGS